MVRRPPGWHTRTEVGPAAVETAEWLRLLRTRMRSCGGWRRVSQSNLPGKENITLVAALAADEIRSWWRVGLQARPPMVGRSGRGDRAFVVHRADARFFW